MVVLQGKVVEKREVDGGLAIAQRRDPTSRRAPGRLRARRSRAVCGGWYPWPSGAPIAKSGKRAAARRALRPRSVGDQAPVRAAAAGLSTCRARPLQQFLDL